MQFYSQSNTFVVGLRRTSSLLPLQMMPQWRRMDKFLVKVVHVAMEVDSRESAHPLRMEVDNLNMDFFDDIHYKKGASVIRMMMFFLTEENFKNGIRNYLHDK